MRIIVRHDIEQSFEPPVKSLNEALRMTPRSHESQHVVRWRVETDGDSRLRVGEDAFGNVVHTLGVSGVTSQLRIVAEGVVETFDAAGIVRATVERFPPGLFLRDTGLTMPDAPSREIAARISGGNMIERLHTLLLRLPQQESASSNDEAAHTDAADIDEAEALAHRFIVCARLMGAPARFIAGYFLHPEEREGKRHVWAEAYVEGVGWIGFDPIHVICPHDGHVRAAIGLDALDAGATRAAPQPMSVASSVSVRRAD